MQLSLRRHTVLPGFGLTMGFTLLYLSLIVLIPAERAGAAHGLAQLERFPRDADRSASAGRLQA